MRASNRDRLILAGSAALAVAVPIVFVWPVHEAVRESAAVILTPVPSIVLRLTGAATSKPLFSADRQPHDVEALDNGTATAAEPVEPPRLVGIIVGPGRGVALIRLASGETVTAGPGEAAGDWRVETIGRSQVTLSGAGQKLTLALDYQNKPAATTPGAALPASPPPPPIQEKQ